MLPLISLSSVLERTRTLDESLRAMHYLLAQCALAPEYTAFEPPSLGFCPDGSVLPVQKLRRLKDIRTATMGCALMLSSWLRNHVQLVIEAEIDLELEPEVPPGGANPDTPFEVAFKPLIYLMQNLCSLQYTLLVCNQVAQTVKAKVPANASFNQALLHDAADRTLALLRLCTLEMDQVHQLIVWKQLRAYCALWPSNLVLVPYEGGTAPGYINSVKLRYRQTEGLRLFVTAACITSQSAQSVDLAFEFHSFQQIKTMIEFAPMGPAPALTVSCELAEMTID